MTVETFHYFFMKVGYSNAYLPLAMSNSNEIKYMWVGFENLKWLSSQNISSTAKPSSIADFKLLLHATDEQHRNYVRIITMTDNQLQCWSIQGTLVGFRGHAEEARIKDLVLNAPHLFKAFKQSVGVDKNANLVTTFASDPNKFPKLLPVKLEFSVPRVSLATPVNSLRTYQSLNRGTFRALQRVGTDISIPELEELNYASLPLADFTNGKILGPERDKGKFFRIYLDEIRRRELKHTTLLPHDYFMKDTTVSLIAKTFSPSQVETLAMLLTIDLKLTPDVGIGNGMDVVDVVATARVSDTPTATIESALASIEDMRGAKLDPSLRNFSKNNLCLLIQCKAYDYSLHATAVGKEVLFIHQGAKSNSKKISEIYLSVESIFAHVEKNPHKFLLTATWIKSQRMGLSINESSSRKVAA